MNPTETIRYLTQQAKFCGERALEAQSEVAILNYASRADIYYTAAAALAIFFGAERPTPVSSLGDADDRAKIVHGETSL